jgi:2-polyprenyl-3-methyl-5-hydroxy-6-metoxy-1,4-benzoquinol methylase
VSESRLRQAILTNYRSGQAATSSGTVYSDIASFWPYYEANYGALVAPLRRDATIIDVGCGPGSLLGWLAARGFTNISGVDMSPGDVRFANEHLGEGTVVLEDAVTHLSARPGAFDVAFMKAVLEHIPKDRALDVLGAVAVGLRPGGFAVIEVPNMDWLLAGHERYMDMTHEIGFTRESLASLLGLVFDDVAIVGSRIAEPTRSQRLLRRPLMALIRRGLYIVGEGASDTLFGHRSLIARAAPRSSAAGS